MPIHASILLAMVTLFPRPLLRFPLVSPVVEVAWFPVPDLAYPFISRPILREGALPEALLIYTVCPASPKRSRFSVWRATIPTLSITCNSRTRQFDCNEAVGYLTFVINHYDKPLAKKYLFVHGHDSSWHGRENLFDLLPRLLKSEYFAGHPYGAIYVRPQGFCAFGKPLSDVRNWSVPIYQYVFANTSMPAYPPDDGKFQPCCATFFMNSELVKTRKKEEYILIRDRLRKWSQQRPRLRNAAQKCGYVMEWSWNVLFAKNAYVTIEPF
jgi:hypothetical protein